MFFKMLKKDIKETPILNFIIFISIIVCSTLIVAGSIQFYTTLFGFNNSLKLSNSTDIFFMSEKSIDNEKEKHEALKRWFNERSDVESFNCSDVIPIDNKNIQLNKKDIADSLDHRFGFSSEHIYISKVPDKTNLVYNLKDSRFALSNGTIALPHQFHNKYKINIGDKLRLTTQLGNIYEFTVAEIFKDASVHWFSRILLSDNDYNQMESESPVTFYEYDLKTTNFGDISIIENIACDYNNISKTENIEKMLEGFGYVPFHDIKIFSTIISVFCSGVAIFFVLIVIMTMRFTLISVIKKEERSLGTLRAIGVDSFSFKWLFTAKYIFFALIGSVVGVLAGIPLTNFLINAVVLGVIKPSITIETAIAVTAAGTTVFVIVLFIFIALRRINKISIISAIHGENRSERFKKIPGLQLEKSTKIKIPLFLALTDILGKFKRYKFLLFSYVFGFAIVLLVFQLKSTVISWDFLHKQELMGNMDFNIELSEEQKENYALKTDGSTKGICNRINDELRQNDIPAFIDVMTIAIGSVIFDDSESIAGICYGISNLNKLAYKKGSVPPKYENEIAMTYLYAKKYGISLGETIALKYRKLNEDRLTSTEVIEKFVVTGFIDAVSYEPIFVASALKNDFDISAGTSYRVYSSEIIATEDEKPFFLQKIRELYGAENVKSKEEFFTSIWRNGGYEKIFVVLRNVITALVLFVMLLNTALYEQIFIEEEASDIALLKTVGFSNVSIKLWHYLRFLILIVFGFVLGAVVTATAGNALMEGFAHVVIFSSGFRLNVNPLVEYVAVPLLLISAVSAVLYVSFRNIFVWRIKDE